MTTTQLSLYNGALRLMGERKLASVSEDRKPRYTLDDIWNDGFKDYVLDKGFWVFAKHTIKMEHDTSITPAFGFRRVFALPSDYLKTYAVCQDEYFSTPLLGYTEEDRAIYSDMDIIFVKYISNDSTRGGDITKWTASFVKYAESALAYEAGLALSQSTDKLSLLEKERDKRLREAKSESAMEEPSKYPPRGSWTIARMQGRRNERGNPNQLIG